MKTVKLNGIEYKVIDFVEYQDIVMPNDYIYLEADIIRVHNIVCKGLLIKGNLDTGGSDLYTGGGDLYTQGGYLYTGSGNIYTVGGGIYTRGGDLNTGGGNTYTRGGNLNTGGGNLNTEGGNLDTRGGYLDTGGGYINVKGIIINSYSRWKIIVYEKTIKIGCKEKTTQEWKVFFENKQSIETIPNSKEYKLIESAFKMAIMAQEHLILMNDR